MKNLNILKISILIGIIALSVLGCKKDKTYTQYNTPNWVVDNGNYSVNMTAVLNLPTNLNAYVSTDDKLAAFVGSSCRGVATLINNSFYITVKGTPDEQSTVVFKYYSSRNKYMYQTTNTISFEPDYVLGTVDNPKVLSLTNIN